MATPNQALPWVPVRAEPFGTAVLPWGSAFHTDASYRGNAVFGGNVTCESNFYVEGTLYSNESIYDTVITNRIQPASDDRGIKLYDGEADWMWFHADRTVSIRSQAPEDLDATLFVDGSVHATEVHTDYLFAERPVQIPNGILTDTIVAGDVACKKTVSERVMTAHASIDHLRIHGAMVELADAQQVKNVLPVEQALQKVQALRGVTFQKTESRDPERRHLGLVAQELEPHVPEVVFPDDESSGPKHVAYGNLVPLLIESIKELKDRVEEQAVTIQTLQTALGIS